MDSQQRGILIGLAVSIAIGLAVSIAFFLMVATFTLIDIRNALEVLAGVR